MGVAGSLGDGIRRVLFQRSFKHRTCQHLDAVADVSPPERGCSACVEEGTRPVHLRMCLTCAHVGCCDSSRAKHARRHYERTGHPLIRSIEPGEHWTWCYVDRSYLADLPR